MAVILQIDQEINSTSQSVKGENGKTSPLTLSTNTVGVGTTKVGKAFEVVGNIVSKGSDPIGTATAFAAESNGLGSLWTNSAYDPGKSGSRWIRTINMKGGNVGIGKSAKNPVEKLEVHGNILATGDVQLSGADCAEEFRIQENSLLDPGTVMVIGDEEMGRGVLENNGGF